MDFYRNENENKQSVTFTDDQSAAIDELISFIAATWSDKDFIRGLCGPGGTGKTTSIVTGKQIGRAHV